jgi:O-antigen/teichoic acid export membrane protein
MTTSVRRRFIFTVGANVARAALSFVTGMLLARALGPVSFGRMAFLLGTFIAIRQLLDLGTSTAFYTFMSQRQQSPRHVAGFFLWLGLQFMLVLIVVGFFFPDGWVDFVWHKEQRDLVLLAFAAAFMQNSVWPVVQQIGESRRLTVKVQGMGAAVACVHLSVVLALWFMQTLAVYLVFIAILFEYLLAAVVMVAWLSRSKSAVTLESAAEVEPIWRNYVRYCAPLVPYSWVGFAYEFADRWLLQNYGGSVQQAYYAVSAQFASVALIATTSILNIFWKEIAEAHFRGDHERTRTLYRQISRTLFLVGAVIAGFLSPWSAEVLRLLLSNAYADGAATLAVMFLYPLHQSLGAIGGTMMYATERVMLSVIVGIIHMSLSIVVTYFVLAPVDARVPGLGLASMGLAIKMVGLQILQANAIAFLIARAWKWPFDWAFQPVGMLGCLGCGWLTHALVTGVVGTALPLPAGMAVGGVLYVVAVTAFVYAMPWLTGLTRTELVSNVSTVWHRTFAGPKPA